MAQLDFDFTLERGQLAAPEFAEVRNNPRYAKGFLGWLADNWHIWRQFRRQADRLRSLGKTHGAARQIVEWMRHMTNIAEVGGEWKINNNVIPDLARLYVVMTPGAEQFFEFRVLPGSERAA